LLELQQLARQKERELQEKKEQLRSLHLKRGELISQARAVEERIGESIERRNELNEKVRAIKEEANKILPEIEKIENELDENDKRTWKLREEAASSEEEVRKRLAELEWKLATESLSPKSESSIVSEIERVRSRLVFHDKARAIREASKTNLEQLSELRSKLDELRDLQRSTRDQANIHHKNFVEAREIKDALSAELDNLKNEEKTLREQKDAIFMEIVQYDAQAQLIVSSLRLRKNQERFERKREEGELRAKVANSVADKIKRGEKLDLEELKIYYEVFGAESLLK
jgi:uncharacterized coiled-coil DUF342 family protein